MIAMRRDEPHWLLNDPDARIYGQALQNALRHIPIRRAQKSLDFAMLVIAIGQFDIPRVYLSAQIARQKAAQARRGAAPVATVYPFNRPPPPPPATPPAGSPQSSPQGAGGPGVGGTGQTGGTAAAGNGASPPGAQAQAPQVDMSIEPEYDVGRFGPS